MSNEQKLKSNRFKEAVDYLKETGRINSQKDLAETLHVTQETISRVLKCQGKNPTDKFLINFARVFYEDFNEEYILNGEGELLKILNSERLPLGDKLTFEDLKIELKKKEADISFLKQQIIGKDNDIAEMKEKLVQKDNLISELTHLLNKLQIMENNNSKKIAEVV